MARKRLSEQMGFPVNTVPVENESIREELEENARIYDELHDAALRFGKADREIKRLLGMVPDIDPETPITLALSESGPFIHVFTDKVDRAGSPARKGAIRLRKEVALTLERGTD